MTSSIHTIGTNIGTQGGIVMQIRTKYPCSAHGDFIILADSWAPVWIYMYYRVHPLMLRWVWRGPPAALFFFRSSSYSYKDLWCSSTVWLLSTKISGLFWRIYHLEGGGEGIIENVCTKRTTPRVDMFPILRENTWYSEHTCWEYALTSMYIKSWWL